MTTLALYQRAGAVIDRNIFTAAAARLSEELTGLGPGPVMPLCSRPGDLALSLAAANLAGLQIAIPHDDTPQALAQVRRRAPDAIYTLSQDDPAPDAARWLRLGPSLFPVKAAPAPTGPIWREDFRVTLYTSGTTGTPVGHSHPPTFLEVAARGWGALLDLPAGPVSLICTAPCQHMYGFETCVLLPLGADGVMVMERRPFFPEDVRRTLADAPNRRILITTPLHLRALIASGRRPPAIDRAISATAPLSRTLAHEAEALFDAPVIEIYGSTETGMLAGRRTAQEDAFTPRADVELAISKDGTTVVKAAHLPAGLHLPDRLEAAGDGGRFRLIGRHSDILKVAGKRASLGELTAALLEAPGVRDGVVALDPAASTPEVTRPLAVVVAADDVTASSVRESLRARVSPVFLPRRILFVDALPRTSLGKLRAEDLDALLRLDNSDANTAATPSAPTALDGCFTIPPDHSALAGHFPGDPIVPGAVILDQALACVGLEGPRRVASVRFIGRLDPGEACRVALTARRGAGGTLRCVTEDGRKIMTAVLDEVGGGTDSAPSADRRGRST